MDSSITTATDTGSGTLASFGSGDTTGSGRLNRRAQGRARTQNASKGEVRAVRSQVNRSSLSARRKKQLLQEIQDNASKSGNIRRGILADIRAGLDDL